MKNSVVSKGICWYALIPLLLVIIFSGAACEKEDKTLYASADSLWLAERNDQAVAKLERLVNEYPDSPLVSQAQFRLGEIHYLNLDMPKEALGFFTKVTRSGASSDLKLKAYLYAGEIYENAFKNYDLAILQYQRIITEKLDEKAKDKYLYRVANAYFKKGDYTQAEIEYHSLLKMFPQTALLLDIEYQKANCKFITGDAKKALERFRRLLAKFPQNKYDFDMRLAVAICHEELSELSKALDEYKNMTLDYPDNTILKQKIDSIKVRLEKKLR